MTSTIEHVRPIRNVRPSRRRKWLIGSVAVAAAGMTTVATAAAYVVTHSGNEPLPAGVHAVEIYTVDDAVSTVVRRPTGPV